MCYAAAMTFKQWRFERRVKRGKAVWGRQGTDAGVSGSATTLNTDPAPGEVKTRVRGELSLRVLRVDGTVEDLGKVSDILQTEGGEK